jgi:pimeloyl-ACP methyl ester carboxylesterase
MNKFLCGLAAVLLGVAAPAAVAADPLSPTDHDLTIEDVPLRPGVEVDLHVRIFVDETRPCQGQTLVAVHGFAHTAATWGAFAEALFAGEPGATGVVCSVAALDLPGHGGSTLPTGMLYGDLLLADYVTAIAAALDGLEAAGLRPHAIAGHSMGGLLIQMLQQRLLDAGTDLQRRHGIHQAVLLASVGPAPLPWEFVDGGTAAALLGQLVTFDPALGLVAVIPDALFPGLFFTDLDGNLVAGAPTPAEVAALGYNAPEPLLAALNLVGAPPLAREEIDPGIFARRHGTRLSVVSYQEDVLIRPSESALLADHLTGDGSATVVVVTGPDTVHDLHLSAPELLLEGLAGVVRF